MRVLIADDQRVVREGLALVLGLLPDVEVVGSASDGDEAVAMAADLLPDVVLMDLRMPRCDGVDYVVLYGGVDDRVVIEDLFEGVADLRPARVFGEVAACASSQGVYHGPVIRVGGKHDDLGLWHAVAQLPGGLDAVTAGHPQIHENDVWEQVSG